MSIWERMRLRGKIIAAQNRSAAAGSDGGITMRTALTMSVAVVAVGLGTTSLAAAPGGIAAMPNATPPTQLVQDNYYGSYTTGWGWGYGFNFTPACPAHYHYSCWPDPYGYRHCGCLLNN
jgi:hypothetical protein